MRKASILLALAALLVAPGSASAFHEPGSEGNSALEQYLEDISGAGGDRPRHQQDADPGRSPLTANQAEALQRHGPVGAAAAELAALTAPRSEGGDGTRRGRGVDASGGQGVVAVPTASEEGSGLASVLDAVFGGLGGGMGIALPLILAASLGAAVALLIARRRNRRAGPPAA
jgi:hypothetical protein